MFPCIRLTCVFALVGAALMAQTATSTPIPEVRTTGMIGIADTQTARLNLLNPGIQPPAMGVVCTAKVSFLDANGNVLKSGNLVALPGKSASIDLRSDTDLSLAVNERKEIRVQITIPGLAVPPPATAPTAAAQACNAVPTLEIFDTVTGRTIVTLGHTVAIPAVQ